MRKFVRTRKGLVFLDSISAIEVNRSSSLNEANNQTVVVYTGANEFTVYVGPDPDAAYQALLDAIKDNAPDE